MQKAKKWRQFNQETMKRLNSKGDSAYSSEDEANPTEHVQIPSHSKYHHQSREGEEPTLTICDQRTGWSRVRSLVKC